MWAFAALLVAAATAALWLYSRGTERRNVAAAKRWAEQGDVRRARLLLEQAVQLNPQSASAQGALAEFYESVGAPQAVEHWQVLAELQQSDADWWRWATSALRFGHVRAAAAALEKVSAAGRESLEHHRLAAGVALMAGDNRALEDHLSALVRLEPGNERSRFALASHRLKAGTQIAESRQQLEGLAQAGPLRARATLELMRDAPRRWPNSADPEAMLAAKIFDGAGAALVRAESKPGRARLVAHLMAPPYPEPADAAMVLVWLVQEDRARDALDWAAKLPPAHLEHAAVVAPLAEAAARVRDWPRLKEALSRGAWGFASSSVIEEAFAMRLAAERGESVRARWQTLLEQPDLPPPTLRVLGRLAGVWGWREQMERSARVALQRAPQERWTWDAMRQVLLERGDTADLLAHLEQYARAFPQDAAVPAQRIQLAYLTGRAEPGMADFAQRLATERPRDPQAALAYALSLRALGRGSEALAAVEPFGNALLATPRGALVHGLLLAENRRDARTEALLRLVQEPLLPEERRLLSETRRRLGAKGN